MNRLTSRKLITIIFAVCLILCMVPFAFADTSSSDEKLPPSLKIDLPAPKVNTHVENTPQYDDTLTANVYPKSITDDEISWYRFHNAKYDDQGKIIQDSYYELLGHGRTYKVTAEDIGHCIKCTVADYSLSQETKPVTKKNYGEPILKVKDNTYYGDTDGSVYYLDQRMEYTHDGINIFQVDTENSSLFSGQNLDSLDPNGYTWMVRFKGSSLEMQSDWVVYTIKAGQKIALDSVSIKESAELNPKNSGIALTATTSPEHAYIASGVWTSSDESVATVNENGLVTAVGNGKAVITYTLNKGNPNGSIEKSAACNVTVTDFDKIDSVNIDEEEITISIDDADNLTRVLSHSIYPATIENYYETWTSSDEDVVIVKDGVISAISHGQATVTYSVMQNGKTVSDSVKVTVLPYPSVNSQKIWSRAEHEDLIIEFTAFPIDSRLKVIVVRPNGQTETVGYKNYTIDGSRLTIDYEYLYTLGDGDFTLRFEMPEDAAASSDPEIVNSAYNQKSGSIISLLMDTGSKAKITNVDEQTRTLDWKITLANNSITPESLTLTPAKPTDTIFTDILYDKIDDIKVTVDPADSCTYEKTASGEYAAFAVSLKPKADGTIENKTAYATITIEYKGESKSITVSTQGFLNEASFTTSEVTIDWTMDARKLNIKQYLSTNPTLSDLQYLIYDWTSSNTYYVTVDNEGTAKGIKNTDTNTPVYVNLKLSQTYTIKGVTYTKSINNLSIKVNVIMYKFIKADHDGGWEALGRVGMNFVIGGVEYDHTPKLNKYPEVTITDSEYNPVTPALKYYDANHARGYRLTYDFTTREVTVEIPDMYMRTLHVGLYHITFKFYSEDGTYIEGTVESWFRVYPKGTALTGDDFNALPYIGLMIAALAIPSGVIIYNKKKIKTSGKR